MAEIAECRGCRKELRGSPYHLGGSAYDPVTGYRAKPNHYGGWVCSPTCDRKASLELERSMPGHDGRQQSIGCFARESFERNWPDQRWISMNAEENMGEGLYDLKKLAEAMRDANRPGPHWLIVLVAPLAIAAAFVSTLWRESMSAWWYAGNAVMQECEAIRRAWRR